MAKRRGEGFFCCAFCFRALFCALFLCFGGIVKSILLVMAQMRSARRAIHKAVRIPRTKIQMVIRIKNRLFAGFADLPIGKSAMPLGSLISHVESLLYTVNLLSVPTMQKVYHKKIVSSSIKERYAPEKCISPSPRRLPEVVRFNPHPRLAKRAKKNRHPIGCLFFFWLRAV